MCRPRSNLLRMKHPQESLVAARPRPGPTGLPLLIAALITWMAVWVQVVAQLASRDPALAWPARIALLAFMACFTLTVYSERPGRVALRDLGLLGQLVAITVLLALGPSGTAAILLILLAATMTLRFSLPVELALLATINLGLLGIMTWHWHWPLGSAFSAWVAWLGFQAFTVLMVRYAIRAGHLAEELRVVNAGLLATRLVLDETARDQERLRVSRELHDVAGHKLTALKLNLRRLSGDPALGEREELQVSARLADELLDELRALVRQLRIGDGLDLEAALRRLAEPLPRPRVEIEIGPGARVPRAEQAMALLRAAQEGLTNAARHANAARAWIRLQRQDAGIELILDDDGRVRWPVAPGNGLEGMRERLELLGGRLDLSVSPRGGLRLTAWLPLEAPA
ncbi:histidine kinase [Wenzhouxiangella sp. XN24]|uniref:sensor histidine kinase n=1 Tax=Wenzhouxiangella sp. XN24 TaxID=2713569 RepID=UPI0013EBF085|nr:histidine kinase [Wenzhouxiangella sp. XN24]NGX14863.1 sensor histidine kinase [Wenzhouxiangella sp. XN24]